MAEQFKVGDQVTLMSGSPEMTVKYYSSEGNVVCVWYSKTADEFKTFSIIPECLLGKP